ncbi:hypothetical protein OG571_47385 (plasmid) [Streptomyces sp. NBC_01369]|uniref:hypothetical protein n=1 Tax=Streptomyces sp. NBC_01369 TaxID=2903842 RepID=UPI002F915B35
MSDRDALLRYDQLTQRVYAERRMPTGTRDLILALGWVTLRDPRRHNPALDMWARTREVLNADNKRMWQLLKDDAPRYEHDWHADPRGCQAPMVRIDRLCGRNMADGFTEADTTTGRFRLWGFCSRPRCQAYGKTIYERAQRSNAAAPEAIPNKGGLLPLFFAWNWETKYAKADSSWKVPVYGLSADEWPAVAGEEPVHAFPKLRLIASGGEIVKPAGPTLVPTGGTA